MYGREKKLSKPKTQKIIRNSFTLRKKKGIKDRINRDIWTLYETKQEKN